ncbi:MULTISPECIES: flagellar biosynthetic protein FliR [Cryobacterium]|uniref:Type III secretion protein n=1 Tax=Cryobacterium glucosi TaxID=1259175 RepID=A0ABY2IQS9_9MICO|nr:MULTISPECIES: flagellar biosynthetic protein FliR [Cryobacterium]MEB0201409.1 flagellar biosynthetic protein FliR [Cryobacterium sp. 5I3]MEB0286396.1 flagellar biosynthetic protein FliR [Cryobacterium sp. 10S3]MEB0305789.1 flagellar biosynthetic protein FliR [Cryobacterium sp. 10I1]TFB95299.1 type III secretion protein [Cryobacterium sp. MDB2-A-1]TFC11334.1 type III secretion protein [Cryobacterium sp. MDB2-A-2]
MNITLDFTWIEAVMLAGVRLIAFLVIAPPFSYNAFPLRIKGMLSLGLALAVSPVVTPGYVSPDTGGFILALLLEIVVGGMLGFLVLIVFSAVQSAGNLIDQFGGFQLAQGFDPQAMVNGAMFTRLYQMTAIALLFASGGYQLIIGGLTRSFTAIPIGGGMDLAAPVQAATNAVGQLLLSAVQIAGPLIVVLFLADAGLGLLTRVAPALNAFALGFPLKILITLTLGASAFVALPRIVSALTDTAVTTMLGVK